MHFNGYLMIIVIRRTMVRAHRQAWCWQDEYHGLTISDIRRLERETQLALAAKMGSNGKYSYVRLTLLATT